jgi:hypothetical protein
MSAAVTDIDILQIARFQAEAILARRTILKRSNAPNADARLKKACAENPRRRRARRCAQKNLGGGSRAAKITRQAPLTRIEPRPPLSIPPARSRPFSARRRSGVGPGKRIAALSGSISGRVGLAAAKLGLSSKNWTIFFLYPVRSIAGSPQIIHFMIEKPPF